MSVELRRRIDKWLGAERSCVCSREHRVSTRIVRLDDAADRSVAEVAGNIVEGRRACVVSDRATAAACGQAVAAALSEGGFNTSEHVAEGPHGQAVVPDEPTCAAVTGAIEAHGADLVVGCGAGTISDLCKHAATQCAVPYLSYPSAASMNGYTSTIAALKSEGLKVTVPVEPPVAVVGDPLVWQGAPAELTAAGFADLLSKYTSGADWKLGAIVEGGYYCTRPAELSGVAAREAIDVVEQIAAGEGEAVTTLMEALILSGLSMAIAGSSSPASGGEHLISHYWDMTAPATGNRRYHGSQVGIGLLICSTLYEMLSELEPTQIAPGELAARAVDPHELQQDITEHFGALAEPVIDQALQKVLTAKGARDRAEFIATSWPRIKAEVLQEATSASRLRVLLRRAGAPTTAAEIGVTDRQVADALRWARHLRARYTVFDFAAEVGCFTERHRAELLRRSGVLSPDSQSIA